MRFFILPHMNRDGQFPEFGDRGNRTCSIIDQVLSQTMYGYIFFNEIFKKVDGYQTSGKAMLV